MHRCIRLAKKRNTVKSFFLLLEHENIFEKTNLLSGMYYNLPEILGRRKMPRKKCLSLIVEIKEQ